MALDICVSSFNFLNKKILSLVWKSIIHCKILVQEQLVYGKWETQAKMQRSSCS